MNLSEKSDWLLTKRLRISNVTVKYLYKEKISINDNKNALRDLYNGDSFTKAYCKCIIFIKVNKEIQILCLNLHYVSLGFCLLGSSRSIILQN